MFINKFNRYLRFPANEVAHEPAAERVNHAFQDLFNDIDDAPVADPTPDETPEPTPEPEEPESEPEPEPETPKDEPTGDEEAEVDYDADPQGSVEVEEPLTESKAVEQAKLKGREAKELKAKLEERELEFERIQKEYENTKARLEEVEATRIDPKDHPELKALRQEVLTDVQEAAELFSGNSSNIVNSFGTLMNIYMDLPEPSPERVEQLAALKGLIVDKLGISEVPYAELDADERKAFDKESLEVLKLIQRNVGKTKKLQELHTHLSDRAKTGLLSVGVKDYELRASEFNTALNMVGDLPDEAIESNPFAIESVVAKLAKEPEYAARLKQAQKDVLEVMAGPRVYTQAEIDRLVANGTDIKQHNVERQKAHRDKQMKMAIILTQSLMTRAMLPKTLKKLAELESAKHSEESETDALLETRKKKPAVVKEEYIPAAKRPLSIDKYI